MESSHQQPLDLFQIWYDKAEAAGCKESDAVVLATADKNGRPSARVVLLKSYDDRGFVFYTNFTSRKGQELSDNPQAALCFYWSELARQIRVVGNVEKVSPEEADEYFKSRPLKSRIGAWASKQSQALDSRFALEKRFAKHAARWPTGHVARPSFWGGFRIIPTEIEFWENGDWRLHDRILFKKTTTGSWDHCRLYP